MSTICAYKILYVWNHLHRSLRQLETDFSTIKVWSLDFFFYVSSVLNVNNRTSRFDSIHVAIIKFVCSFEIHLYSKRNTKDHQVHYCPISIPSRLHEINLYELSSNTNLREFLFSCSRIPFVEDCVVHSFRCTFDKIQITRIHIFPIKSFDRATSGSGVVGARREKSRRRIFWKVYLSLRDIQNKHFFSCNYHNSPSSITQEIHVMFFEIFPHIFHLFFLLLPFFPPFSLVRPSSASNG